MTLPIALQLYTVREELEKDMKGTLQKVKAMGYDGVEFAGLFGHEPAEVKAMLNEVGLTAVSAHVPLDDLLKDPAKVIADYISIGCKYVAVPYVTEERRPGADGFAQTIKDVEMLGKEAHKQGITLLYHNHDFEFKKIGDEYGLDVLYASIAPDYLQTEVDTCWVNVAGEDPAAYVRKYTGRAPVVHLKDFVMANRGKPAKLYELIGIESDANEKEDDEAFAFRPVGYGLQNIPEILKASIEAGAEWVVVEQDRPAKGDTPMHSAELSIQYLNSFAW